MTATMATVSGEVAGIESAFTLVVRVVMVSTVVVAVVVVVIVEVANVAIMVLT